MDYKWFIFILMASVAATVVLALWKALGRRHYSCASPDCPCRGGMTFIGKLSWLAVPWPLFIGLVIVGWPYVWAVLRYEIYKGL